MHYLFGAYHLDTQRYELHHAGVLVPLRPKVFQVLAYLVAQHDRVVRKEELLEALWPGQFVGDVGLNTYIMEVRKALGDRRPPHQYLRTVRGQGYRVVAPVEVRDHAPPPPCLSAPAARTDLPDEPPTQDATPASFPGTPDAERRQLTVMFCDLSAAPAHARPLDPEDLYPVLRTYQETCASIIRYFDGHIAQYRGEGMVVYFGYPRAHDDDAQRAVRAGLRLVEAMGELHAQLLSERGIGLAVRVGLHTGVVVVGTLGGGEPHERWALGEASTFAAQMQGLAAPDTVVISEATQRLIQGYFTCRALGAQTCHGVATPLQAYRVVQDSGAISHLDAATAKGLTPLVGREHEVGLLVECWGHATAGLGRVAVISGEAGIGKSRLVRVLQKRLAAEPHTQIEWNCSTYDHQSPLHPVRTHLQRLVRMHPDDAPAEILRRLEEVLEPYGFAMAEVVPLFAALLALPLPERYPPLMLTPQRQKSQTLEALRAWLLAETTRQPVLFIIEDVQWMDPSTLEWLSLLIDQAPTARLLTVLTCRPEFHPPWGFHASLTSITLGRLSHAQATILVQRIAGKALPPEVQRHLVANTDGVPLFIEELTKTVLESELLQTHEDRYELTGPLPALAIPATLHDSLMARLDRLAPLKAVAQLGATLGRSFAYDVLHAVSPWDETVLQRALGQLVDAELLYQRGVPPQATYLFKHALIQEAAYQSLLKSTRQQFHQRFAQVLEARFPDTVATQPELLAHHYTEANLPAQALPYWQRAGQRALEHSAYQEAMSHLTNGVAVLTTLPETRERTQYELDLQIALGAALMATKGQAAPDVERAYARARALSRQVGDTPQVFPALFGLWGFYEAQGEISTARELAEQLLLLAQHLQDSALLLEAHHALGATFFWLGDVALARAHLEQGIALYAPHQHRALAFLYGEDPGVVCHAYAARALWFLGYPDQALTRSDGALALARKVGHPFSLAYALTCAAALHQFRRDGHATQAQVEAAITVSTEQELPYWMAWGTVLRGWALAAQGHEVEGLMQMRQGLAAYRATGAELLRPYFLTLLAEAYGRVGQTAEGLRGLTEALALVYSNGARFYEAELHRLKGDLLWAHAAEDDAAVQASLRQALDISKRQQAKSLELRTAMSLSRLWQRQGQRVEAYALLAPIYGWFTEGFDTADLQDAKTLLEELGG
jgi:class 3 adenylate cyclase/predicted ATPase